MLGSIIGFRCLIWRQPFNDDRCCETIFFWNFFDIRLYGLSILLSAVFAASRPIGRGWWSKSGRLPMEVLRVKTEGYSAAHCTG